MEDRMEGREMRLMRHAVYNKIPAGNCKYHVHDKGRNRGLHSWFGMALRESPPISQTPT